MKFMKYSLLKKKDVISLSQRNSINEVTYETLRKGINGGISTVFHRYNIKGKTKINRFKYDKEKKMVILYDAKNVITHVVGVNFNSLYPSAFSSNYHEFNPYHGGIMFMPGSQVNRIECYDEEGIKNIENYKMCEKIIYSNHKFNHNPSILFIAEIIIKCPEDKINDFINFPPVIRKFKIKNDVQTLGYYMYEYGKKNKISSIDKKETKLIMTLDPMGQFAVFNNYYLWLLLDLGRIITDIKQIILFDANKAFSLFVNEFMNKRQQILAGEVHGNEKFNKISMNGSYGYDGMNAEKFSKIKICDKDKAYQSIISDSFINGIKSSENN